MRVAWWCAPALVDATLLHSASVRHDEEARWASHRRRKPMQGYKAHGCYRPGGWPDPRRGGDHSECPRRGQTHCHAAGRSVRGVWRQCVCRQPRRRNHSGTRRHTEGRAHRHLGRSAGARSLAGSHAEARHCACQDRRKRSARSCDPMAFIACVSLALAKAGQQVRLAAIAYNLRRSWRSLTPDFV